jgi:hypothetical protein
VAMPDFIIIGAPKAGTTALHAALALHPDLHMSPVKEPKYFLCDGRPPPRGRNRGPGDAHSAREWIWRRERYEALFAGAPPGALRGETTTLYLYDRPAHDRIARAAPHARLIAVLRDPVDRAYSNWMHLWSDGLEPLSDFRAAWEAEDARVRAGWAPFWHYRRLGRYGEQLAHLLERFPREHVHVLRYRDLADTPNAALDGVCRFLGVAPGVAGAVGAENARSYVRPSTRATALSRAIRAGASLGSLAPPEAWRAASRPLLHALQAGGARRPLLEPQVRQELIAGYADDIVTLERISGQPFADWLGTTSRGQFEAPDDGLEWVTSR